MKMRDVKNFFVGLGIVMVLSYLVWGHPLVLAGLMLGFLILWYCTNG